MALTRPKLKEILSEAGADEEKIASAVEKIISGHTTTTEALKEDIKIYKENAEKLPEVEKELQELRTKNVSETKYKEKYEKEHKALEELKGKNAAKDAKDARTAEYTRILKSAGINEKRINTVIKVADANGIIDSLELDENGKVKNESSLIDDVKNEWADFRVETSVKGADTQTPPTAQSGNNDNDTSAAAQRAAKYYANKYGTVQSKEGK